MATLACASVTAVNPREGISRHNLRSSSYSPWLVN